MCEHYFLQPTGHAGRRWQLQREDDATVLGEFATFTAALDHVVRTTRETGRPVQIHARQDAESPWRTMYWAAGTMARYSE